MIKALIFDFDGTIVDNLDAVFVLIRQVLDEKNIKLEGDLKTLREKGVRRVLAELKISKLEWLKYYKILKEQIRDSLLTCQPVNRLPPVLKHLSKEHQLYVMSSNKKSNIEEFLTKNNLSQYFTGIYEDKSYFGKHDTIKKIKNNLKLLGDEIAYVGDEARDVEAARKAGIKSIAVAWGFEGEEPLSNENPDFLIHQPKELLSLVR